MTEFEQYEVMTSFADLAMTAWNAFTTHVSIYLTMLFAYCVVAFTVGSKLSRFQVLTLSIMFVIGAEMQVLQIAQMVTISIFFADLARDIAPEGLMMLQKSVIQDSGRVVGFLLWQIGILAALFFMWDIRHPKTQ